MRGDPRGFTLLETLVAMAILGLGVASVLQLMGASARSAARTQATTEALFVAEELMEELNALDEPEFRAWNRRSGDYAAHERSFEGRSRLLQTGSRGDAAERYAYAVRVAPDRDLAGLFRVDVEITWKNGGGGSLTLTTARRFALEEMPAQDVEAGTAPAGPNRARRGVRSGWGAMRGMGAPTTPGDPAFRQGPGVTGAPEAQ